MSTRDDKDLEQYLAGDSELSGQYRREAGDDAPPPEIDARLRAAARREVGAGPARRPRLAAWTRPLAAAAVVLLAVGVTLQLLKEPETRFYDQAEPVMEKQQVPVERRERRSAPEPAAAPASKPTEEEGLMLEEAPSQAVGRSLSGAPADGGAGESDAAADRAGAASTEDAMAPAAWLNRIRDLASQGRAQAALDSYARFKQRYPDYPVPGDLLDLLGRPNGGDDPGQ
jgi:hypothetical protein